MSLCCTCEDAMVVSFCAIARACNKLNRRRALLHCYELWYKKHPAARALWYKIEAPCRIIQYAYHRNLNLDLDGAWSC
jgi:hypothetical protein